MPLRLERRPRPSRAMSWASPLIVAALTVLLGTLFPLMAEAAGRTISVGEPYFNLTFTPMLALLLLILPVVQAWAWGKADLKNWSKYFLLKNLHRRRNIF